VCCVLFLKYLTCFFPNKQFLFLLFPLVCHSTRET
jgi:hypothetical protein